jgi:2',3'-cyclic-nucleotide 2'-phosphodiesterase (5'-nucleotidase family)
MAAHTGVDIAFINAGALRASIRRGPITVEDVFKAVPYANELMTTTLTGAEVEAMLARSVRSGRGDEDGGFLQVSGISFEVRDRRAINIRVGADGRPLDPGGLYTVAVPDFLSTGGDGYSLLTGKAYVNTRLPLRELIVDTIRAQGSVSAVTEGRIRRLR